MNNFDLISSKKTNIILYSCPFVKRNHSQRLHGQDTPMKSKAKLPIQQAFLGVSGVLTMKSREKVKAPDKKMLKNVKHPKGGMLLWSCFFDDLLLEFSYTENHVEVGQTPQTPLAAGPLTTFPGPKHIIFRNFRWKQLQQLWT